MLGRNTQFVAKAENKGKETREQKRKKHCLPYEGRSFVLTKGKNWQYKAEFVYMERSLREQAASQSLYYNRSKVKSLQNIVELLSFPCRAAHVYDYHIIDIISPVFYLKLNSTL
jgi:hypothetical protein